MPNMLSTATLGAILVLHVLASSRGALGSAVPPRRAGEEPALVARADKPSREDIHNFFDSQDASLAHCSEDEDEEMTLVDHDVLDTNNGKCWPIKWDKPITVNTWFRLIAHGLKENQVPNRNGLRDTYWNMYLTMWDDESGYWKSFLKDGPRPNHTYVPQYNETMSPAEKDFHRSEKDFRRRFQLNRLHQAIVDRMQHHDGNKSATWPPISQSAGNHSVNVPGSPAEWLRLTHDEMVQLATQGVEPPAPSLADDEINQKYYDAMLDAQTSLFLDDGPHSGALAKRQLSVDIATVIMAIVECTDEYATVSWGATGGLRMMLVMHPLGPLVLGAALASFFVVGSLIPPIIKRKFKLGGMHLHGMRRDVSVLADDDTFFHWANQTAYAAADSSADLLCHFLGDKCSDVATNHFDLRALLLNGVNAHSQLIKRNPRLARFLQVATEQMLPGAAGESMAATKARLVHASYKSCLEYIKLLAAEVTNNTTAAATHDKQIS